MVAASVWSLLIPAIEQSENLGAFSFLPAFIGFWLGILFLLALDHIIPHLHMNSEQAEGPRSQLRRTTMMVLAVTLHNIPEGMAVGVIYAGFLAGDMQITAASAFALSLGIAIQNFPEGAIISLHFGQKEKRKARHSRRSSFRCCRADRSCTDTGCGTVDSASASLFTQFAAGAMLYVVIEEMIPEMSQGKHSNIGTLFFAVGFSIMMMLDVALG